MNGAEAIAGQLNSSTRTRAETLWLTAVSTVVNEKIGTDWPLG